MPRGDYKWCKRCGKHTSEVGPLSNTRLCAACGPAKAREHLIELAGHSGPAFLHWRRRIAASVGAVLVDDLRAKV
jgi:hypothetical protein